MATEKCGGWHPQRHSEKGHPFDENGRPSFFEHRSPSGVTSRCLTLGRCGLCGESLARRVIAEPGDGQAVRVHTAAGVFLLLPATVTIAGLSGPIWTTEDSPGHIVLGLGHVERRERDEICLSPIERFEVLDPFEHGDRVEWPGTPEDAGTVVVGKGGVLTVEWDRRDEEAEEPDCSPIHPFTGAILDFEGMALDVEGPLCVTRCGAPDA